MASDFARRTMRKTLRIDSENSGGNGKRFRTQVMISLCSNPVDKAPREHGHVLRRLPDPPSKVPPERRRGPTMRKSPRRLKRSLIAGKASDLNNSRKGALSPRGPQAPPPKR